MGKRIIAFMTANNFRNRSHFAEGVIGISKQRFHQWLYKPMDPSNVGARPILLCAEALGTNAEYLLCLSDDPRAEASLTYEEAQLVQAYRDLPPDDQAKLLAIAADWVARAATKPSTSAPFRLMPK